jgi:hypothetical protein
VGNEVYLNAADGLRPGTHDIRLLVSSGAAQSTALATFEELCCNPVNAGGLFGFESAERELRVVLSFLRQSRYNPKSFSHEKASVNGRFVEGRVERANAQTKPKPEFSEKLGSTPRRPLLPALIAVDTAKYSVRT